MHGNSDVSLIYLDFANVFDKGDDCILNHKLRNHGISDKLLERLHVILKNRSRVVPILKKLKPYLVARWTVLGEVQFIIALLDIPNVIRTATVISYVDYTNYHWQ